MTKEEIHNIYLHMSGKAEGIAEAMGTADFPVLFANAILEYAKRPWQGLTEENIEATWSQLWKDINQMKVASEDRPQQETVRRLFARALEATLKKKNA